MWENVKASESIHAGVIGSVTFTGTGTDDLSVGGNPEFASARSYVVEIDGTETYRWSNDNGVTWEASAQPIEVNVQTYLKNAEGESEGIYIVFGSQAGHVSTDTWAFTTTGQVVPASATLLKKIPCLNSEIINIKCEYSKGTEDGLRIYVELPRSLNGTVGYPPSRPVVAGGVMSNYPEIFEVTASSSFTYTYETNGSRYINVYAVRKGVAAVSGLFTVFVEQNRVRA